MPDIPDIPRYITDTYQLGLKDLCSEKIIDKDKQYKIKSILKSS